jgi:hypothetical protein
MWFRLARDLGYPVAVLRAIMPYSEFLAWCAWYEVEPRGEDRDDWRSALQSAVLANLHRNPKKKKSAYLPQDFRLQFAAKENPHDGEQAPQATQALVEMLAAAYGGRILVGDGSADNAILSDEE